MVNTCLRMGLYGHADEIGTDALHEGLQQAAPVRGRPRQQLERRAVDALPHTAHRPRQGALTPGLVAR